MGFWDADLGNVRVELVFLGNRSLTDAGRELLEAAGWTLNTQSVNYATKRFNASDIGLRHQNEQREREKERRYDY